METGTLDSQLIESNLPFIRETISKYRMDKDTPEPKRILMSPNEGNDISEMYELKVKHSDLVPHNKIFIVPSEFYRDNSTMLYDFTWVIDLNTQTVEKKPL